LGFGIWDLEDIHKKGFGIWDLEDILKRRVWNLGFEI
jgi:hypothetical protein